jgi:hypothetical protein
MRVAIGLKARTGRAILVAIAGDPDEPRFVERAVLPLLPEGAFAPYHAAEHLEPAAARRSVERDVAVAHRLAAVGIRDAVKRLTNAGDVVAGCGVLVGPPLPEWSTEQIVAVHVRMHQAEGVLFREVLGTGARACGFEPVELTEKRALAATAERLGLTRKQLDARLSALGKSAGPPWGKDQKEATAAALVALGSSSRQLDPAGPDSATERRRPSSSA